ncbi:MAG: ornithine cyclodeaminase family protein [Ignavibacteriales bacterium]
MRDARTPGWKPGKNMLFLSSRDVRESISMREAIEAAAAAYAAVSGGAAQVPVRTPVHVQEQDGVSLFMPGAVPGAVGMKMASVFPRNPSRGLPVVLAAVLMVDPETGAPACLMEGTYLTALRTGAAAAVASDHMARRDACVAAIFGAGVQARTQLMGLLEVRRLSEIRIVDINMERARGLADELAGLRDGPRVLVAPAAGEAVRGADIIVTATTSRTPLFDAECLKAGAHINGIGSFKPDMQEIGEDTVLRADRIIVDSRDAALEEAGDIIIPLRKGLINDTKIAGEIGDLVRGRMPGRTSPSEITFCKMVGLSALDVTVGSAVFAKAVAEGKGTLVDL